MDFSSYLSLSQPGQRLLAFMAFAGSWRTAKAIPADVLPNTSPETTKRLINSLVNKGFLAYNYFFELDVAPHHFFRAKAFARSHFSEIVERHSTDWKTSRYAANEFHYLEALIYAGDTAKLADMKLTSLRAMDYIAPVLTEPAYVDLLRLLPAEKFSHYVIRRIEDSIDKCNPMLDKRIDALLTSATRYYHRSELQDCLDAVALYYFLALGILDTKDLAKSVLKAEERPYFNIILAIKALYDADYDAANAAFATAFKVLNKTADVKNVFSCAVYNYFLIITYARLATQAANKKIEQFVRKDHHNYSVVLPATILCETFLSDDRTPSPYLLRRLKDGSPLTREFYSLFTHYFSSENTPKSDSIPALAFMRYEMSPFIDITSDEVATLAKAFGPKPALASIRREQPWEVALNDVVTMLGADSSDTDAVGAPKNARIIYILSGSKDDFAMSMRMQTVLKSGKWSVPKLISYNAVVDGKTDGVEELDIRIARECYDRWSFEAAKAIRMLVGCDRVYNEKMQRVEIRAEDAYLMIEPNRDGFKLSTNIPKEMIELDRWHEFIVRKQSEVLYSVINIPKESFRLIRRLMSVGTFPAEAEPMLRKIMPALTKKIDVHSDMADNEELVEGGSMLSVQLAPDQWSFNLRIMAVPVTGTSIRVVPGVGSRYLFDTIDKRQVRIKRNIKAEQAAVKKVAEYFEDTTGRELSTDGSLLDLQSTLTLLDYAARNPGECMIEWPRGEALRLLTPPREAKWHIGIRSVGGWFEIEGDVQISDDKVISAAKLMSLINNTEGEYIRLNDKEFLRLDAHIRRQLQRIEAAAVNDGGELKLGAVNAAVLDDDALNGKVEVTVDDSLLKLREKVKQSFTDKYAVPRALKATLRDYQNEGFRWMCRLASWGAGACLADDMGLGKTVQTIAFLLDKCREGAALVVAPASVIPNWRNELLRFAPSLKVAVLNSEGNRADIVEKASAGDVIIATYGLLHTATDILSKKEWTTVVLDEAHTIKNRDTKMSSGAMALKAKYRIILTGTPIQNSLSELWNLFHFINPTLLGSFESFQRKFILPIEVNNDKERRRALQRLIKPFILRRTKAEVVDELPEKMDINIPVELNTEEMTIYESLRRKAAGMLEELTTKKVDISVLAEITRLRRCACSPQLVNDKFTEESSKTRLFLDMAAEMIASGRMLVFSQFTSYLKIIADALDKEKIPYLYLDGSTPIKKREQLVAEFQTGDCPVFLISLKAGGLGLNLTGANYVVHLDPWWNPAIEQQATDRAYRIGQDKNVTVYHLIAQHTIEEKILRLHATKRRLADDLLDGTNASSRLTRDQLLELLAE